MKHGASVYVYVIRWDEVRIESFEIVYYAGALALIIFVFVALRFNVNETYI